MLSRRNFLATSAATVGGISVIPFLAQAGGHSGMVFGDGAITAMPIAHASVVLSTPVGAIYVDPVGDPSAYADKPPADLVLITHEHGDHLNNDTLAAVMGAETKLIANQGAVDKMNADMAAKAQVIGNGETTNFGAMAIDAIAAYNTTADRLNFHPQGRDNGYVLSIAGTRIYLSSDTEDVPEMRALQDIDVAFVCMNLPFTMDIQQAASAVNAFKPKVVIPYHYRGREDGTQDPIAFAALLEAEIEAMQGDWYGKGPGMV